jgi:alpha-galactosidase
MGMLFGDFDTNIQMWHTHLRKSVLRPMPENRSDLFLYNHWAYCTHEMDEQKLKNEIDIAKEVGAEIFVVDAGWYGNKGTDWGSTVGDWDTADRLPNGLEPVFGYARQKGLLCGLWLDFERIGRASKIVKDHPNWQLTQFGQVSGGGLVDFTNPEVANYFEAKLIEVIERYKLDLFRLDYNTDPHEGGQLPREDYMENAMWRYYEAVYRMYENISKKYPNMIMENCAGGGGRTDLGMLRNFHYTWCSDWQIAPRSIRILNGMTIALPPERIDRNAGVGQDAHLHGDLDFQIRQTMLSHMTLTGVYPSVELRNNQQVSRIKHHIETYKRSIRPILNQAQVFHHTPILQGDEPRGWCVLEYMSPSKDQGFVALFRLDNTSSSNYKLLCRGVDRGRNYHIIFDNSFQCALMSGECLFNQGVEIRLERPLSSELIILQVMK